MSYTEQLEMSHHNIQFIAPIYMMRRFNIKRAYCSKGCMCVTDDPGDTRSLAVHTLHISNHIDVGSLLGMLLSESEKNNITRPIHTRVPTCITLIHTPICVCVLVGSHNGDNDNNDHDTACTCTYVALFIFLHNDHHHNNQLSASLRKKKKRTRVPPLLHLHIGLSHITIPSLSSCVYVCLSPRVIC